MTIAYFDCSESEDEQIKKLLYDRNCRNANVLTFSEPLNEQTAIKAKDAVIVSIFIHSKIDRAVLDQLPNLRFIAARSTGTDHIDISAAHARNIEIANVPAYGSATVAEFTIGLLIALVRNIVPAANQARDKNFDLTDLGGIALAGKTIGVIGTGHIGRHVLQLAVKGLGMNGIAYDLYPNEAAAQDIGYSYVPLEGLLENSDIISLHVPATADTKHLLDSQKLDQCKNGVYILNTARGDCIDSKALLNALNSGKVRGAGLDVFEDEQSLAAGKPNLETLELLSHPKVLPTPHLAFFTQEAEAEIQQRSADNIANFFRKNPA